MNNPLNTNAADFCWATGIENTFIPHVRPGLRKLDEYELTQHYQLWKSDFDLLADTGVSAVRWGIPWYRVQPSPDEWEWRWTDEALDYLVNVKGITPILDLVHYGTPLWLDNTFINAGYPQYVAEYARAVAARYKNLVRYYTPLNEPMIHANVAGRVGVWPPYLKGNDGYVKLILALSRGIVLTTRALKEEQPDMLSVQVEAVWQMSTGDETLQPRVELHNLQQYLSFDLVTGRVTDDHPLCGFLTGYGASEADLIWFRENAVSFDFFGANFYPWSYGPVRLLKDGLFHRRPVRTHGKALAEVVSNAYARYQMPVMVTETSAQGDIRRRGRWMDETITAMRGLRQSGVPVAGYTWFPFFSMFSWNYRTGRRPLSKYLIHLGLYDAAFDQAGVLHRHRTPLVDQYQQHIAQPMPPVGQSQRPAGTI